MVGKSIAGVFRASNLGSMLRLVGRCRGDSLALVDYCNRRSHCLLIATLIGSWNFAEQFHEPWTLAGSLPIALWALAALGMLWATVPLAQRIDGLNSFHKLVAIPFLAIQFRNSNRGIYVLIGFLVSCAILLLVSWALVLLPGLAWRGRQRIEGGPVALGLPVKDYIAQASMFTICILGLAEAALLAWRRSQPRLAVTLVVFASVFLANILYVATSRTALVALPVLLALFAVTRLDLKRFAGMLLALGVVVAAAWPTSSYLRERVTGLVQEIRKYEPSGTSSSAGERLEFSRKSMIIIAEAPVFGHGTGSNSRAVSSRGTGSDRHGRTCVSQSAQSNPGRGNSARATRRLIPARDVDRACAICLGHRTRPWSRNGGRCPKYH